MKDLDYFNIDLKGRILFRSTKKTTQLITHLNLIQHFGCPVHTSPSVKVLELSCLSRLYPFLTQCSIQVLVHALVLTLHVQITVMPFSLVSQKIFLIGSEFYRSLQHGSSPALSLPIILHLLSSSITDFPFFCASSASFCFSLSLKSPSFSHPFLCSAFHKDSYSPDCSSFQRVPETSTAVHIISETYDHFSCVNQTPFKSQLKAELFTSAYQP